MGGRGEKQTITVGMKTLTLILILYIYIFLFIDSYSVKQDLLVLLSHCPHSAGVKVCSLEMCHDPETSFY